MTTILSATTPTAALWLDLMLDPLRAAVKQGTNQRAQAAAVARALRGRLPSADILDERQRQGSTEGYQQHVLHVEPGLFSVTALVWLPGQQTTVHDHICWCAVGVLSGVEHEVVYRRDDVDGSPVLTPVVERDSYPGQVDGFAPPGDIHRVHNVGSDTAISLHVYGADIGARGTSVRRVYTDPIRP